MGSWQVSKLRLGSMRSTLRISTALLTQNSLPQRTAALRRSYCKLSIRHMQESGDVLLFQFQTALLLRAQRLFTGVSATTCLRLLTKPNELILSSTWSRLSIEVQDFGLDRNTISTSLRRKSYHHLLPNQLQVRIQVEMMMTMVAQGGEKLQRKSELEPGPSSSIRRSWIESKEITKRGIGNSRRIWGDKKRHKDSIKGSSNCRQNRGCAKLNRLLPRDGDENYNVYESINNAYF